jgi:hypothetical protein
MSDIIKQDLELRAFKRQTGQCLALALKENTKKTIKMPVLVVW